jgi:hypothetical protein
MLIERLMHKGDLNALYDAESFAQVTLDNLKDPAKGLNQESRGVADGYYDLGTAINQCKIVKYGDQGNMTNQIEVDLGKAEMLARESLRIRSLLDRNNHYVGTTCALLANILLIQGNLSTEVFSTYYSLNH